MGGEKAEKKEKKDKHNKKDKHHKKDKHDKGKKHHHHHHHHHHHKNQTDDAEQQAETGLPNGDDGDTADAEAAALHMQPVQLAAQEEVAQLQDDPVAGDLELWQPPVGGGLVVSMTAARMLTFVHLG
jgi:hypothetical protein